MTKMLRKNENKPKLSFILDFPNAMEQFAKVMEMGEKKYAKHNWKNGMDITDMEDSLLRHLTAFHNCEDNDEESGLSHLAHIIFNASAIIEHTALHGEEFDNRDWEN